MRIFRSLLTSLSEMTSLVNLLDFWSFLSKSNLSLTKIKSVNHVHIPDFRCTGFQEYIVSNKHLLYLVIFSVYQCHNMSLLFLI